jgi:hypothetical protein
MSTITTTTTTTKKGRIRLFRKILRRGFLHPIQISIIHLDEINRVEDIVHKLLLRSDGRDREIRVMPGTYILRAREVPLGCNIQGEELRIVVNEVDPVCVTLRTGSSLQVLLAGFGGCLFPIGSSLRNKAFYFDEVSMESFNNDLNKAPTYIATIEKSYAYKSPQNNEQKHPNSVTNQSNQ